MPRGDKTGPQGMGPMTGRGAGFCAGVNMPGSMNPAPGLGLRQGHCGGGRGRRNMANAVPATEGEALRRQVETLQAQLDALKGKLAETGSQATS